MLLVVNIHTVAREVRIKMVRPVVRNDRCSRYLNAPTVNAIIAVKIANTATLLVNA